MHIAAPQLAVQLVDMGDRLLPEFHAALIERRVDAGYQLHFTVALGQLLIVEMEDVNSVPAGVLGHVACGVGTAQDIGDGFILGGN